MTAYMPDGRPAPFVMTSEDLLTFLRVEVKHPSKAIQKYKAKGLKAARVSSSMVFLLPDVLDYLKTQSA